MVGISRVDIVTVRRSKIIKGVIEGNARKSQIKSRLRRRGLERNSSIFKKQFALILELLAKKGMQSKQDGVKFYAKLYKCICLMGKHIYLNC